MTASVETNKAAVEQQQSSNGGFVFGSNLANRVVMTTTAAPAVTSTDAETVHTEVTTGATTMSSHPHGNTSPEHASDSSESMLGLGYVHMDTTMSSHPHDNTSPEHASDNSESMLGLGYVHMDTTMSSHSTKI